MRAGATSNRALRLLFWETTIRCNLACAHCRRLESNESDVADLSKDDAENLIGQVAELGHRQLRMPVLVFSGGEPLCRSDLFDLVREARRHEIPCALATNGTLIDEDKAAEIRDSGIARVSVSLDGAGAETHDGMRQIPGSFDRVLVGAGHLRDCGVPFQINVTLTKQNAGQLEEVYELARSLGAVAVHVFMLVPVGCGLALAETDMLSPLQYEEVMRRICKLERRGHLQIKVTCGPHYERIVREEGLDKIRQGQAKSAPGAAGHGAHSRGCLAGLGVLFVNHRGEVYPCGYLPVNCGNVLESRLADIWDTSTDLARMRDSNALEGKCGVCGYRTVCGGCRGRAFAATGNYMAQEPFCAYVPPGYKATE